MIAGTRNGGVVLAGRDHRSVLAVARAFARRDIPLVVVGVDARSAVGVSRHVRDCVPGPNPAREPEAFARVVYDVARTRRARLVLPMNDATMAACDGSRQAIEAVALLAAPSSKALWNVLDKTANLVIARRLGIPCAAQFDLEHVDRIPEAIERLGFPIVLKNPGPFTAAGRAIPFRWLVARNERELRGLLAQHCGSGVFPLVQEFVSGAARNVCFFAAEGELLAAHEYISHRRWEGEGVLRELTPLTPELYRHTEQMVRELHWSGVGQTSFFVNEHNGSTAYMETNGRFWGSIAGTIRAGWDLPSWTYRYFVEGVRPVPPKLAIGSRTCWHYGDLRALVQFLRGGVSPTGSPRSRSRAVFDYLSGFRPGVGADVFRLDDPLPELVEHWRGLRATNAWARRRRQRG